MYIYDYGYLNQGILPYFSYTFTQEKFRISGETLVPHFIGKMKLQKKANYMLKELQKPLWMGYKRSEAIGIKEKG